MKKGSVILVIVIKRGILNNAPIYTYETQHTRGRNIKLLVQA